MINEIVPVKENDLELNKRKTHVLVDVGASFPLVIELPPLEEIVQIKEMKYSLETAGDLLPFYNENVRRLFENEYQRRLSKQSRFEKSPTFFNRLAIAGELAGDLNKALEHIEHASTLSSDVDLAHRRGILLVRSGQFDAAKDVFSSEEFGADSKSLFLLSLLFVREQRLDDARRCIDQSLEVDPLNAQARIVSGILYLLSRDFKRSIAEFRVASEDRPKDPNLFHNLALAYLFIDREDKALDAVRRAYTLNPLGEESAVLFSDLLIRNREFDAAKDILRHFLRFNGKSKAAQERLALANFRSGSYQDCIEALKVQASLDETSGVWNNIAVAYFRNGDSDRSLQYYMYGFRKMVEEGVHNFTLINNFINALNKEKKFEEAIRIATYVLDGKSVNEIAKDSGLISVFGLLQASIAEQDPSAVDIQAVDRVIASSDLPDKHKTALLIFAAYHYTWHQPDESRAVDYARVMAKMFYEGKEIRDETKSFLINNSIFTFLEFGKIDEAEKYIKDLLPLVHHHSFPTATYGLYVLKAKKSIKRAEELYREAMSLTRIREQKEKLRGKLYLELSRAYDEAGDKKKAKQFLERAMKNNSRGWFARPNKKSKG